MLHLKWMSYSKPSNYSTIWSYPTHWTYSLEIATREYCQHSNMGHVSVLFHSHFWCNFFFSLVYIYFITCQYLIFFILYIIGKLYFSYIVKSINMGLLLKVASIVNLNQLTIQVWITTFYFLKLKCIQITHGLED